MVDIKELSEPIEYTKELWDFLATSTKIFDIRWYYSDGVQEEGIISLEVFPDGVNKTSVCNAERTTFRLLKSVARHCEFSNIPIKYVKQKPLQEFIEELRESGFHEEADILEERAERAEIEEKVKNILENSENKEKDLVDLILSKKK